jgi:hypothetical protein
MNDRATLGGRLDRECVAFSQYLIKQKPNSYVLDKYCEAHATSAFLRCSGATSPFDRLLLRLAAGNRVLAKLVDAYTCIFFKSSTVRRKWILLLAILESCAPTYHCFDSPDSSRRERIFALLVWRGLAFSACMGVSILLFMPLHLLFTAQTVLLGRR